jgi:hypothetical protein
MPFYWIVGNTDPIRHKHLSHLGGSHHPFPYTPEPLERIVVPYTTKVKVEREATSAVTMIPIGMEERRMMRIWIGRSRSTQGRMRSRKEKRWRQREGQMRRQLAMKEKMRVQRQRVP